MNATRIMGNARNFSRRHLIPELDMDVTRTMGNARNLSRRQLDLFMFDPESPIVFPIVLLILAILGFLGNLVTILTIMINRKLRSPTFAAIGCLALADLLNLVFYWFFYMTNLPVYLYHVAKITVMLNVVSFIRTFLHYLSAFHILLLSVLRYGLIVQPLQCRNHVTVTVILMTSLVFWLISCLIAAAQQIFLAELYDSTRRDLHHFLVSQLQYAILQCLVVFTVIVLHHLKMKVLRNSLRSPAFVRSKMNQVITIVLAIFSVNSFIAVVMVLLIMGQQFSPSYRTVSLLYNMTLFFNVATNPYIYFMSFVLMKYLSKCIRHH
ncbi:C-C chemokine receptor type 7-like [Ostrea edulis]|uniref:C-C chemokine receptor type 7-like n=1 Tax=Ostrea edulis TaxID=37623 RepID=UPI0024AF5418|nr:C-C chemokine receptor type 7-like [Ostrea edulis]